MAMKNNGKTTIWVTKETKEKLAAIGKKTDTYETIILRLLMGASR